MKSMIRTVTDGPLRYEALMFVCPGCATEDNATGLHILPVNTKEKSPSWDWDGNLESPTVNPSILTGKGTNKICHSWLKSGVFQFLTDSTHKLAGQKVPIPDLPDWVTRESEEEQQS